MNKLVNSCEMFESFVQAGLISHCHAIYMYINRLSYACQIPQLGKKYFRFFLPKEPTVFIDVEQSH